MGARYKSMAILCAAILVGIASVLFALDRFGIVAVHPVILMVSRWLVVGALVWYASIKRSLTTWIFVAMACGVEVGLLDMPLVAGQMKLFQHDLSAAHQDDHSAADIFDAGGGDCGAFQFEAGGADGAQGAGLL